MYDAGRVGVAGRSLSVVQVRGGGGRDVSELFGVGMHADPEHWTVRGGTEAGAVCLLPAARAGRLQRRR